MGRPARVTLTEIERRVIDLVGQGLSNAEAADQLGLSAPRVRHHVRSATRKLVRRLTVQDGRGLPPREREVLDLLGEGISDAQIAERLGIGTRTAETLVRKALQRLDLRRADVSPSIRGTDRSGLTRREREVAGLVRQGMKNARIADELGISIRTVEAHVASVLRKHGKHRRSQL